MLHSLMIAAGSTGTEDPPGMTAFSLRPFQTPPACSSSSLKETPSGAS